MRRIIGATLALAACSIAVAAGAQASPDDKVLLCHGTASEKNPYVLISVSENALNGHLDGTGPGHGENNHEDVLLSAGSTDCSDNGEDDDGGEF